MSQLLCGGVLAAVCVAVWCIAPAAGLYARINLRFAAALFSAPAVAVVIAPPVLPAVGLIVGAIDTSILALAMFAGFQHRMPAMAAILGLVFVCVGGVAGAVTGVTAFALAPSTIAAVVILLVAARHITVAPLSAVQGMLSAAAFLAANSCSVVAGAQAAQQLFWAAGLLGVTLALARVSDADVEQQARRNLRRAVSVAEHG